MIIGVLLVGLVAALTGAGTALWLEQPLWVVFLSWIVAGELGMLTLIAFKLLFGGRKVPLLPSLPASHPTAAD